MSYFSCQYEMSKEYIEKDLFKGKKNRIQNYKIKLFYQKATNDLINDYEL